MLIESNKVAEYLGATVDEQLVRMIDAAESLLASWLGCRALEERDVTYQLTCPRTKDTFELDDGPIANASAVSSITVDGVAEDLSDWAVRSPWSLVRHIGSLDKGAVIVFTYKAGFTSGDSFVDATWPKELDDAVMLLCAEIRDLPSTAKRSERIGDYAYTLGEGINVVVGELPERVKKLARYWRQPML